MLHPVTPDCYTLLHPKFLRLIRGCVNPFVSISFSGYTFKGSQKGITFFNIMLHPKCYTLLHPILRLMRLE